MGNIAKIVIYDQARVNGGSNYEYPGQRWVLKLVINTTMNMIHITFPVNTTHTTHVQNVDVNTICLITKSNKHKGRLPLSWVPLFTLSPSGYSTWVKLKVAAVPPLSRLAILSVLKLII